MDRSGYEQLDRIESKLDLILDEMFGSNEEEEETKEEAENEEERIIEEDNRDDMKEFQNKILRESEYAQ